MRSRSQIDVERLKTDPGSGPTHSSPTGGTHVTAAITDVSDPDLRIDHLTTDLKGRTVRGGAVALSAQAVKFAIRLGSTAVLARLLTPADFGLIAMVAAVTGFIGLFRDLGLSTATVQRAQITHGQVSNLFWINVVSSIVLMGITAAAAPGVAWFYGEPRLVGIMLVVAATFICGGLTAQHTALLRRHMRFTVLARIEVVSMATAVTTAIVMAWRGFGYWSLVGLETTTVLTTMLLAWVHSPWRPGLPQRRTGVRAMLKFGASLSVVNFFHHVGRSSDGIFIGRFLGAEAVGLYSRASGLVRLPTQQLVAPMASVMVPALSRLADQPVRFRAAAVSALRMVAMLTIPTVAMLIVHADWIVLVVLGPAWIESSSLFRFLCLAAMVGPSNGVLSWILTALGQTRTMLRWSVVHNFLVVASIAAGLPWGVRGVAISYALTGIFLRIPYFYWVVSRVSPLSIGDFYRTTLPYLLIGVGLCGALLGLRPSLGGLGPYVALPISLAAGGLLYLLALLILPFGRRALRDLLDLRRAWSPQTPA